ncbi:larval cuticle protein 65Ab1-like [Drosophila tropicalis]|uniref:larval cuticle protein 65Ab1-like n=1 Tax=Drosophila tropicalis TaxID=46794 RepID=UPI0035AB9449
MKFVIVLVALFALASARPTDDVAKDVRNVEPENYNYELETSNGISLKEEGVLKNAGSEHEAIVVHGSYSWVDEKTGEKFTVTYVADENGFQPSGAHLPVAP